MKNIGAILVVFTILIHDAFVNDWTTNTSIMYYTGMYLGIALLILKDILLDDCKVSMWVRIILSSGMILLSVIELSKWNMPYNEYIISVNSFFSKILFWGYLSITLLILTLSKFKKCNSR